MSRFSLKGECQDLVKDRETDCRTPQIKEEKKNRKRRLNLEKITKKKTPHHHPKQEPFSGNITSASADLLMFINPCQGKRILLGPCWWSSQGKKLRVVKILNQTGYPGDCRGSQGQALPNRFQAQKPCSQGQALPNRSRVQKIQS